MIIEYEETGQISRVINAPDEEASLNCPHGRFLTVTEAVDDTSYYVDAGTLLQIPVKPFPHHEWDWSTKSWLPNLDAARAAKKAEVEAELASRLYLPYNGFDADPLSRDRISGTIARLQRGDPLPAGWIGWRDASNQQQWASDDAATVLANLISLSRAIEDREQSLLVRSWQHKAAIAALEDVTSIHNYDISSGW